MPELGQMIFGNKWEECEAPDFLSRDLYSLSELLGRSNPEEQAHGILGGQWGYGQDFENDVFVMFPYWWGECECGYDEREWEWTASHEHSGECYQTEMRALGLHEYTFRREHEDEVRALCERHGVTYPYGSMVHCTCDHKRQWHEWLAQNSHVDTCPEVRPNFLHKRSGLAVHWYKYIGRSMTVNRPVSFGEWVDIYEECRAAVPGR